MLAVVAACIVATCLLSASLAGMGGARWRTPTAYPASSLSLLLSSFWYCFRMDSCKYQC